MLRRSWAPPYVKAITRALNDALVEYRVTKLWRDYLLADDAKLEKTRFPQPPDSTAFPSRESLGVYHAILRLLGRFETLWVETGEG